MKEDKDGNKINSYQITEEMFVRQSYESLLESLSSVDYILDPNGTSHLIWIFDSSNWTAYGGSDSHRGDDYYADDWIENSNNTEGQNAYAMAPGEVIYAGNSPSKWSYGIQVVVRCRDNESFAYRYAHLQSKSVNVGDQVEFGTLLGKVGKTGGDFDPHLHSVLYKNISSNDGSLANLQAGKSPIGYINEHPKTPSKYAAIFYNDAILPTNNNIYKWLGGTNWNAPTGGTAVKISVANNGYVWVVNNSGMLWRWDGYSWGNAIRNSDTQDISCGANGSIVITTSDKNSSGGLILKLINNQWTEPAPSGRAKRVDVDSYGNFWVVNGAGDLYKWNGSWNLMRAGDTQDVGCGQNGMVVVTLKDDSSDGGKIMKYLGGNNWQEVGGRAVNVDIANDGSIWVINKVGLVWQYANGNWFNAKPSGGNDIGCSPTQSSVWITVK